MHGWDEDRMDGLLQQVPPIAHVPAFQCTPSSQERRTSEIDTPPGKAFHEPEVPQVTINTILLTLAMRQAGGRTTGQKFHKIVKNVNIF